MQVIILSGLPGCGKTTWLSQQYAKLPKAQIASVCTDDFFLQGGEYRFARARLGEAHNWCLREYLSKLMNASLGSMDTLVVDNTNCSVMEIAPYYRLAECLDCPVEVLRFHIDPLVAFQRNIHQVPLGTTLDMHKRLSTESLPVWWNVRHQLAWPLGKEC